MAADDPEAPDAPGGAARMQMPDDALLLLNRATLVVHSVRSAVHELNNVLQMIGGSAEMLASAGVPLSATPRIDAILRQTGRGHAILQAVGDLARPDQPHGSGADVDAVVDRTLQLRRYEHTRSGITATVERRGAGGRARIDPQQLLQILLNLVVNAEQAVAGITGAAIVVGVSAEGGRVEITVSDNGPGLARATEVTAPFVTTRGPSAAGLGLPASILIARRWGGDLQMADAGGSRVTLTLPAASLAS
jgi:C4-dicarboxylate-specific signal transduction histidine kinase